MAACTEAERTIAKHRDRLISLLGEEGKDLFQEVAQNPSVFGNDKRPVVLALSQDILHLLQLRESRGSCVALGSEHANYHLLGSCNCFLLVLNELSMRICTNI